ncbi:chaperone protein dnaJ 6-like protein [Carex littledalei]|uniref:Chaperone protein dnaJ 6-like protein n=1 Tax=Carex littledalei TaxID=544730 RepID=A0A833QF82_9POAL|nr:chaperone protein dnaJ 6-like protein [Carex littledalei]
MGRKKKTRVSDEAETSSAGGGGSTESGKSLYEILGVERTATQQEIKKAYKNLALRLHPDKNPGDENAKSKFQLLQKVISILGDEEKRSNYDRTGITDDDALDGEAANDLRDYFRTFKKVTEEDIEEFEANYRGSDSEKNDLKELYAKFEGNMNRLFCSMICSDEKLDSHRFKDIIDDAISQGELKSTKAYKKWAKKVSQTEPPTNPLARPSKKRNKEVDDLALAITERRSQRKEQFNSILSSIVSKCNPNSQPEPTDEEFEKARQRLESSKPSKKRK